MIAEDERRRQALEEALEAVEVGSPLSQALCKFVRGELLQLQQADNRERVVRGILKAWDPCSNRGFTMASMALTRMAAYQEILQAAWGRGRVFPWVYTPAAAWSFDSVYQATVLFWLSVPTPADRHELAPPVRSFISRQVNLFAAAVGPSL